MLQKPGSGGSKARAAARTSRQKTKSPDDIVRELQRLPTNKKCADCFAKLPYSVNLSYGTFVCLVCAGIHREFSHRIKGIGHSSFSVEEANAIKELGGNEAINAKYLATYKESYESLKQPSPSDESNDQMKLRYWIRKKYIEQAWVVKEETVKVKKEKGKKKKKEAEEPVKEPVKEVDLFSDDALFGAPAPAPASQQSAFVADFGNMTVSAPAPSAPSTSFNADFGNFSSTPITAPPTSAPPAPADPFANPPTSAPPAPSSDLFANAPTSAPPPPADPFANPPTSAPPPSNDLFASAPTSAPPPPSDPFAASAPSSFNADFGNFSSAPTSAPTPAPPQEDAFADFNSHQTQPEPEKTGMPSSNTKSKFDAFDELSVPEPVAQPNNNNTNNNQDITKSPQHQYMYQMISNLNIEQLVILQQVIDYRMNQMKSQGQMNEQQNQQQMQQQQQPKKEDTRFANLVDFSAPAPAPSNFAPPPSSAPPPLAPAPMGAPPASFAPPPMGAPPVPTSPSVAPAPMGAPPPPPPNFLF